MDAETFLKNYSQQADVFLKKFFNQNKKTGAKIDPRVVKILEIFQNYCSGGKKLRGALTVLGYQLAGGKNLKAILPVSCGIELLHNFLLIHDDIIDKDEVRRGKPTVHKIFSQGKNEHYGLSMAMVTGDAGAFLGYELIVSSEFSKQRTIKALSKLNDYLLKTAYGEILDIEFDFKKKISWDEILKVRTYKTAYYTIVMPLTVGAILGGAEDKTTKAIEGYAVPVGIAFQLADDILGVFGEIGKTGKSNESDIREGKKTLLFAKSLDLTKGRDREFLLKWYGSSKLDKDRIEKIRFTMRQSGALNFSQEMAQELVQKGKTCIPQITSKPKYKNILSDLADFVISKEK